MKYVEFHYSAGMCGTDEETFGVFDDDATDEDISDVGFELCSQHCESYGVYPEEYEEENGVEFEYDYSWKEVSKEEVTTTPEDFTRR